IDNSAISEYEKFRDEMFDHDDLLLIEVIRDRLLSPQRAFPRPYFQLDGFFKNETNSRCNLIFAIPDGRQPTGLRLFCLLCNTMRTLIFCNGLDKGGWIGRYQDQDNLKGKYDLVTAIGHALQGKIESDEFSFEPDGRIVNNDTPGDV